MKKLTQVFTPGELLGVIFLGIRTLRKDDEPTEIEMMLGYLDMILDRSKEVRDAKLLVSEMSDLLALTRDRGRKTFQLRKTA